ncbi:MAG: hypothetical protein ACJA2Q_001481 [Pseudohongiellaceae bacterium]|jgi:uncharacterized protein (TIGR01777 family)
MPISQKNILITGASGMIGKALTKSLSASGYRVYPLLRNSRLDGSFYYDEQAGAVHLDPKIPLYAVINLAGANISDTRWNDARKEEIISSRELLTKALSESLAKLSKKPAVYLSGSAIGYYGPTPTSYATEASAAGTDFLAEVAKRWESATSTAISSGIRTIHMRFGIVLSVTGGVLKNFLLPMRLAVVGAIGSGQQKISWMSIHDVVRLIELGLADEKLRGPINFVSNSAATSDEFSQALSSASGRFRLPKIPAPVARLMFGEMADAALLASSDVRSTKHDEMVFELQHPNLEAALKHLLDTNT